jgi:hypothetical protein
MMPWTIIIADFLEQGKHWDLKEVATVLRNAQAEIDGLKKEWQGLTDDELDKIWTNQRQFESSVGECLMAFGRAIELALKEKNFD